MSTQNVKEKTGENDTLYANMLTAIFEVTYYSGKYKKAIEYGEKEKEMNEAVKELDFETAAILRDEIKALEARKSA